MSLTVYYDTVLKSTQELVYRNLVRKLKMAPCINTNHKNSRCYCYYLAFHQL